MSGILGVLNEIQSTEAEVHKLEQLVVQYPERRSLRLALQSLAERQEALNEEFNSIAFQTGVDVCSYRLFNSADSRPSIGVLSKVWGDFQALFTTVYDATKNGPKHKAKFSADVMTESALQWGYTFVGSIGVVLTVPNERLLLEQTELDKAVEAFTHLVQSTSSEHIAEASKTLGRASVVRLKQWAEGHINAGLGADFKWMRGDHVRAEFFVQEPEIENLHLAILETSDEVVQDIELLGRLVGIDVEIRTFHIIAEDGSEIRGKIDESIGVASLTEVPKVYNARIRRWSKLNYATGEESITHRLLDLNLP